MAEIKSTIDLVMERTAGLVGGRDDRAETTRDELAAKAKGLAARLLDGALRIKDIDREADRLSDGSAERAVQLLRQAAGELIDQLDLTDPPDQAVDYLAALAPDQAVRLHAILDRAVVNIGRDRSERLETARQDALKELAAWGLTGSAVRPKVRVEIDQAPYKADLKKALA